MGENTLNKQDMITIQQFLNSCNIPQENWKLTLGKRAIKINCTSVIYNNKTQQLTFQGGAKHRIPTLGSYLLYKREKECQTRGYNAEKE